MTKDDLKTGMVVEMRDGEKFTVMIDSVLGNFFISLRSYANIEKYNENLTHPLDIGLSIDKILEPKSTCSMFNYSNLELIWERKEKTVTINGVECTTLEEATKVMQKAFE